MFRLFCGPVWRSRYSCSLRVRRSGDQIPLGAVVSAPVQTGPGAHPASCTMDSGFLSGTNRPGRGVDHPPPSSAEFKEIIELCFWPPVCLHGSLQGEFRRFHTTAMFRPNHYKSVLRGRNTWRHTFLLQLAMPHTEINYRVTLLIKRLPRSETSYSAELSVQLAVLYQGDAVSCPARI
jgi:hypothetical protein